MGPEWRLQLRLERMKPHCGKQWDRIPRAVQALSLGDKEIKPWVSPALSLMLDLRPLSRRGSSTTPHRMHEAPEDVTAVTHKALLHVQAQV